MSKVKTEKQINQAQKRRKRKSRLNHKLNHADLLMSRKFRILHKAIMRTRLEVKPKYKNAEIPNIKEWR